jgi:integrase
MGDKSGVRAASSSSIEIDFYYRGVRCRERINLPPTPRHLAYAQRERGAIINAIALGTFDYAKRFPDSPRSRLHSAGIRGEGRTVEQALRDWFARAGAQLEHSTLINHIRVIDNILVPKFGAMLLRDFKRTDLRDWLNDYKATSKRINNVLGPLRGMFADELDAENIDANPIATYKVKRPRQADKADPIDPFTPDELRTILSHCDGQLRNLFQFAAWSGLRTSELIALQWKDVDFKANVIHVRAAFVLKQRKSPKTETGVRIVELLKPAADALKAQQQFTLLKGGAVFENPKTNSPWMTDKQIREWSWRPVLKAAGVRYRYPYQLRHTFASMTLSVGENLFWVAKQMGHKDPHVTSKKYARFIKEVASDAGKKTEALWV